MCNLLLMNNQGRLFKWRTFSVPSKLFRPFLSLFPFYLLLLQMNTGKCLSGGACATFVGYELYSINVVGNIWEPRKFTRYHISNRQVNAYAIA